MRLPSKIVQTHFSCFNYAKDKQNVIIEIKHFEEGTYQGITPSNEIVAILKGTLNYSCGRATNEPLAEGDITVLSNNSNWQAEILEEVTLIIFRLTFNFGFCDYFSFEMLYREKNEKNKKSGIYENEGVCVLSANDIIRSYLILLERILADGVLCGYLLQLKLKELLYLFRYYYSVSELEVFFSPVLSDDFDFSLQVMKNYDPSLTAEDLAKKTHYSLSGFEKRFKKVFDMPVYQWIQSQKAQAVYHEINCSNKTFAELSYEFGFSSPSHFNNFCKRIFKNSPGEIRKKGKKEILCRV